MQVVRSSPLLKIPFSPMKLNTISYRLMALVNISQGYELDYSFRPYLLVGSYYSGQKIYIANHFANPNETFNGLLTCIDLGSGQTWSRRTLSQFLFGPNFTIDDSNNSFIVNGVIDVLSPYFDKDKVVEVFKIDPFGNTIWKKGMAFIGYPESIGVYVKNVQIDADGNLYAMGRILDDSGSPMGQQFIIKLDGAGNLQISKTINGYAFNEMLVDGDGIVLLDKASTNPNHFSSYPQDQAILVKLDFDLNLIWAKKYSGENFNYYQANIKPSTNGNYLMTHSTFGAFPAVLTELDNLGNIISQMGYPNYEPQIEVLNDGSILLSSSFEYDTNGTLFPKQVIAKTDINGIVGGCPNFSSCIQSEEIIIEFGILEIEPYDNIKDLENYDVEATPVTFSFSEGCNFPPAPIPNFTFPDTLCIADSARTSNTYNRLANAFEWHLIGQNMDSINMDSFDFGFRFKQAGEYLLKHTLWVLGCSYSFEKNITVLEELDVTITPEALCLTENEITVTSNRILKEYKWGTGSTSPILPTTAPGIYSVQVSDGYCTASDTAKIELITDIIGYENPILLPADTTICNVHLPFLLTVTSSHTDLFFINGDSVLNDEYPLTIGGNHSVFSEIFGCPFTNTFQLETDDCQAAIYFPTVFSPNNNGINDGFLPMGKEFEPISLMIFDRWGGLLHDGKGSNMIAWSPKGSVAQGTYLYLFLYKNLLTEEVVQEAGEVVLMR